MTTEQQKAAALVWFEELCDREIGMEIILPEVCESVQTIRAALTSDAILIERGDALLLESYFKIKEKPSFFERRFLSILKIALGEKP